METAIACTMFSSPDGWSGCNLNNLQKFIPLQVQGEMPCRGAFRGSQESPGSTGQRAVESTDGRKFMRRRNRKQPALRDQG